MTLNHFLVPPINFMASISSSFLFFEEFRFTCVLGTYGVCVIVRMTSLVVLCCYSFSLFFRYLRKSLYGMHPDLKYAGIMSNTFLHSILCTYVY